MSHRGITIAGDGMGSRKSAQESNHTQKKQGINIGGDGMGGRKGTARDWLFGDDETEEQAPIPRRSKFTESKNAASNASSAAPVPSAAPVSNAPRAGATRVPNPAYPASDSAVLYGDKALYERIARASYEKATDLVQDFEIPIRSGKAWVVKKGQLCTLSTPYGAQVGDLNMWSLSNPRERFWAARTRQLHASHVSVGDRLWSNLPYLRPLATIVGDSLKDYGVDSVGGRVHDLLGTRCDPYVNKLLSGADFDFQCHSNLVRAVIPYGLNESDVHDVLNVFQVTGLNVDGKYFMEPSPAKSGDYFTFFAETDLLCAMSTCPGGDLSVHGWGEGAPERMLSTCKPLGVKVFELDDRVKSSVLRGWKESKSPAYKGIHGVQMPVFGQEKRS